MKSFSFNYLFALATFLFISSLTIAQNALKFDGINDYVQTNYPGISGAAPRTIEAWINTTANCDPSFGGVQNIITDWGSTANGARFTFNILWGNAIRLEVAGNGLSGTIPVNDGNWHHVAVVYDPSSANYIKLYVDGVLDVEGTLTVTVNTATSINMRIGQRVDAARQFDGKIDEVRVWNTAKSITEINANMSNELCSIPSDLKAYFRLNSGIADGANPGLNVAVDNAGLGYTANLVNFALSGSTSNWTTGANLSGGFSNATTTASACNSYTWSANGNTYTGTGTYSDVLVGANSVGCDSIVKLILTINTASDQSTSLTECDTYTWPLNGMTYTSSATVVEPQTTAQGCPYTHTLDLTINASSSTTTVVDECTSYFWEADGATYTTSGTYTSLLNTVDGCDSTVTLQLTITDVNSTVTNNLNGTYSADILGATYEWVYCTLPVSSTGNTNSNFTPTTNGNYALVTTLNGCSDTSACFTVAGIGLNELEINPFTVFPNPTSGVTTIRSLTGGNFIYEMTDLNGKVIMKAETVLDESVTIELNCPIGFYFLRIEQSGVLSVFPIVVN